MSGGGRLNQSPIRTHQIHAGHAIGEDLEIDMPVSDHIFRDHQIAISAASDDGKRAGNLFLIDDLAIRIGDDQTQRLYLAAGVPQQCDNLVFHGNNANP